MNSNVFFTIWVHWLTVFDISAIWGLQSLARLAAEPQTSSLAYRKRVTRFICFKIVSVSSFDALKMRVSQPVYESVKSKLSWPNDFIFALCFTAGGQLASGIWQGQLAQNSSGSMNDRERSCHCSHLTFVSVSGRCAFVTSILGS